MKNKTVVLGVTGGIAAYKSVMLVSLLKKSGADVHVVMTKNATEFVTPLTFQTISGNKCITSTFDKNIEWDVGHISLAKKADVLIIAPATANVIAKLAHGIADDMLTTTALAMKCPKIIVPAMNTAMLENPVVQENLKILTEYGYIITETEYGTLACKDKGKGRMLEPEKIFAYIEQTISSPKNFDGTKILITAGGTRESIDPVRYITNHSSGKMGYALAKAAILRGANVTLISGVTALEPPKFTECVNIVTADEMYNEVKKRYKDYDIIIKAAAVADYRPENTADYKMKKSKDDVTLKMVQNRDILLWLGENKLPGQILIGFCLETENLIENAKNKLKKKNADVIAANLIGADSGFGTDNNTVTLLTQNKVVKLGTMSKYDTAHEILSFIKESLL